MIACSV
ncbi:BgTH12-01920 [Blumeria graminis f. sp. triticale]|nr:BgTH12-01920 [Blumeria graminis f. sp. triticale]